MPQIVPAFVWQDIDTVLLDMDGTLLDKFFDDAFWCHHVPKRFAQKNGIDYEKAHAELFRHYKAHSGSLAWTDMDHWSQVFDLDIFALKHELAYLIAELPGAIEFLQFLKRQKKRIILTTNCHPKALALKLSLTRIEEYFDDSCCASELQASKEEPIFWQRLLEKYQLKRSSTLFIDDNHRVLETAEASGLFHLVAVARPTLCEECCYSEQYPSVAHLNELISA